jgi:hypothetical protein
MTTVVQLETTNRDNYPLGIVNDQLALQSGPVLQSLIGSDAGGPIAVLADEPLPAKDFGRPVHLVATAHYAVPEYHGLFPPTSPPAPPWLNELERITLRVPFALTPVRSGSYTFHQAPVVEQGVGVQALSLNVSPARSVFYGMAGGARIELRLSGLPADMELLSFVRVQSRVSFEGGSGGNLGPGQMVLQIPGMTVGTPALVLLQKMGQKAPRL